MANCTKFLETHKSRRTYYQLSNESPIPEARIKEIVEATILHTPSSFNSQSTRLVVLVGSEHEKFWDFLKEIMKVSLKPERYPATEQRLNGFRAAYGSILFYEDPGPIKALQEKLPTYHDKFPQWSEHTSAMHQLTLWTALEAEGFGCNLQHYNPLIDKKAADYWKIPEEWSLKAQLVFGKPTAQPGEKEFEPLEKRLFFHGI